MTSNAFYLVVVVVIAVSQYVSADTIPIFKDVRDSSEQLSVRYDTDTGISVTETGRFKLLPSLTRSGQSDYVYVKEGSYSYTTPEGQFFKVDYIADENGYRLKGSPKGITEGLALAPYA